MAALYGLRRNLAALYFEALSLIELELLELRLLRFSQQACVRLYRYPFKAKHIQNQKSRELMYT